MVRLPRDWSLFVLSRSLAPTNLPLFPDRLQLPISLCVDLLLPPRQHVLRRDAADGAVQADGVVMLDVTLHQTPCIFQRQRRLSDFCQRSIFPFD